MQQIASNCCCLGEKESKEFYIALISIRIIIGASCTGCRKKYGAKVKGL